MTATLFILRNTSSTSGPEAGEKGGELLYAGPSKDFEKKGSKNSHTYQFMMGQEQIPIPLRRRLQRMEELRKNDPMAFN
jgi:excinuclease UvrABC ATPase subunit